MHACFLVNLNSQVVHVVSNQLPDRCTIFTNASGEDDRISNTDATVDDSSSPITGPGQRTVSPQIVAEPGAEGLDVHESPIEFHELVQPGELVPADEGSADIEISSGLSPD